MSNTIIAKRASLVLFAFALTATGGCEENLTRSYVTERGLRDVSCQFDTDRVSDLNRAAQLRGEGLKLQREDDETEFKLYPVELECKESAPYDYDNKNQILAQLRERVNRFEGYIAEARRAPQNNPDMNAATRDQLNVKIQLAEAARREYQSRLQTWETISDADFREMAQSRDRTVVARILQKAQQALAAAREDVTKGVETVERGAAAAAGAVADGLNQLAGRDRSGSETPTGPAQSGGATPMTQRPEAAAGDMPRALPTPTFHQRQPGIPGTAERQEQVSRGVIRTHTAPADAVRSVRGQLHEMERRLKSEFRCEVEDNSLSCPTPDRADDKERLREVLLAFMGEVQNLRLLDLTPNVIPDAEEMALSLKQQRAAVIYQSL